MRKLVLLFSLVVLVGCADTGRTLPSATGSIYECVVVSSDAVYDSLLSVMGADMPCLPQMEPYFSLSHVRKGEFDDFLKSARNILYIDIQPSHTHSAVRYARNQWSRPQALAYVSAADTAQFFRWWGEHGSEVRDWFVREELSRQAHFLRASTNSLARQHLQQSMGADMLIPDDYLFLMDTTMGDTQFFWCCNNKGAMRRDLVVYSYPYSRDDAFSLSSLCAMRDSLMGRMVTASVEGSYMGTEYAIFPPVMRSVRPLQEAKDSHGAVAFYAMEVRGLWKIRSGEAMGGPFVSLSRLDGVTGRVVTAETFVYAAGMKKRNALRQAEAILYTLTLKQDIDPEGERNSK